MSTRSPRLRAVVLCPGRGSYQRDDLGSLTGLESPALDVFDTWRADQGQPTVSELDAAARYSARLHVAGEQASLLTAGISLADLDQLDPDRVEVVAVCGNSMGWYTALGYAGALSLTDTACLIDTMGGYQAASEQGVVGGQIVYPLTDEGWRLDPKLQDEVDRAVAETPDLYWSIRLGGQAVLGGTDAALRQARERLPPQVVAGREFPLRLPLHSAFHTPLMGATAARAAEDLGELGWRSPRLPLIDGRGAVWRPRWSDPAALRDYTLGVQVTAPFDFTTMIATALGDYAPDAVILPGPGSNLGGAVAQVMIALGWQGLHDKADFVRRQQGARPVLLSLRWPEQRQRVVQRAAGDPA